MGREPRTRRGVGGAESDDGVNWLGREVRSVVQGRAGGAG